MILINCPYCGERDQSEFSNGGEAHVARPENSESLNDKDWGQYVFYRDNPKGIFYERWVHSHGCKKWFNAVRNTSTDEIFKIYKLDEKPRIEVSTIHASKGGERDNVMLLTDLSYGPYKSSKDTQQGRDDELRVFYVGATRAKKKLVIVHTTEAQFEFEPIFFHEKQAS